MPDPLGTFLKRPALFRAQKVFCGGHLVEARETVPGVWRCERCGEKVRIVW